MWRILENGFLETALKNEDKKKKKEAQEKLDKASPEYSFDKWAVLFRRKKEEESENPPVSRELQKSEKKEIITPAIGIWAEKQTRRYGKQGSLAELVHPRISFVTIAVDGTKKIAIDIKLRNTQDIELIQDIELRNKQLRNKHAECGYLIEGFAKGLKGVKHEKNFAQYIKDNGGQEITRFIQEEIKGSLKIKDIDGEVSGPAIWYIEWEKDERSGELFCNIEYILKAVAVGQQMYQLSPEGSLKELEINGGKDQINEAISKLPPIMTYKARIKLIEDNKYRVVPKVIEFSKDKKTKDLLDVSQRDDFKVFDFIQPKL